MRKIIVGSRRSKLALTQTNWVIDQLKALDSTLRVRSERDCHKRGSNP